MAKPLNSFLSLIVILTTDRDSPLPDGKFMLLKQAKDGPLAKALSQGGINDIMGLLALSQSERDVLSFPMDDGTEILLSVGHKSMM